MAQSRLSFKEPSKPKTETASTDFERELERVRENVDEKFGYSHIAWHLFDKNRERVAEFVKEHGYTMQEGVLVVGFWRGSAKATLEFGYKPDKKTLKRMIKENKNGKAN